MQPAQTPVVYTDEAGRSHADLKRDFVSYLDNKREEVKEQQDARRYYHGSHYTATQIAEFNRRKQPVVTYNRIARKINAIVGLLERQRNDPRAFPRTPKHEEGAELVTATLRYVLDNQNWAALSAQCGLNGSIDGIAGLELSLIPGRNGDLDIGLEAFDPASFFYDPRSLKPDFSDARYMGISKWADLEAAIEMFPDKETDLRGSVESDTDLTTNPDSEKRWYADLNGNNRRVRIVDHWYKHKGKWHWCVYTGSVKLASGESPFVDDDGKQICKFVAYSATVDHDGDRYGFIRNMRSANDEINQRRSKSLHLLNSRRIIIPRGTYANLDDLRREAARPDGVIEYNQGGEPPIFDDSAKASDMAGQMAFMEDAKAEIENYGFNPALVGTGVQDMSGRAIRMQQEAGIAELGPFLISVKDWKIRVYRAVWCAIKTHWKTERWIRVTDDENIAQFIGINQPQTDPATGLPVFDPMTGAPVIANQLGELDVDIIIDEGPDTINMQADAYETLTAMATSGQAIPPAVLIELSPLHGSKKRKILEMLQQSGNNPMQDMAAQLQMAQAKAKVDETNASAQLKTAQAEKTAMEAMAGPQETESRIDPGIEFGKAELQANTQIRTATIRAQADMERERMRLAAKAANDEFALLSGVQR